RFCSPLRLPEYCRAALRTKTEIDRETAVAVAPICPRLPYRIHVLAREKRSNTIGTASALLAVETMAQCDHHRVGSAMNAQLPTCTGRRSCCHPCSLDP